MKKYFVAAFLSFGIALITYSQDFLPFTTSNYAGITGVHQQPASIADSRYKFDMTIAGVDFSFGNSYLGADPYLLWHPGVADDDGFKEKYIHENSDDATQSAFMNFRLVPISFMFNLSDKDALAFSSSTRLMLNVDDVSTEFAKIIYEGDSYQDYLNKPVSNANFSIQANAWVDYGITYARVLVDKGEHFLKAGATVKLVQGLGSAYFFAKELSYNFLANDSVSIFHSKINYGASENFDGLFDEGDFSMDKLNYRFAANPSLGLDLGFVYEYRPSWESYKYDLDGKTNLWRQDQNKYLFRIGLSILDIGSVKYKRGPLSNDFTADISNWNFTEQNFGSNYTDWMTTLRDTLDFLFDNSVADLYKMNLPTAISLQADVRISNGLYFHVSPYIALNRGSRDVNKLHYLTTWNFVPRFEGKYLGISLPIQYTSYKQMNVGAGVRLGPLWMGSTNIISILAGKKDIYGANASLQFKFPIYFGRVHDKDKDKVSDKKDKCPELAGVIELEGCPDADFDGVTDANDQCPDEAGLKELNGCPDRDGDGITDGKDACPDVKGLPQFEGCPDSDGDGIIDSRDDCPFNSGLAQMNGCPDQDGDGIPDKDDNCPTVQGTVDNKGCPFIDSDGDGVKDEQDHCPGVAGPIENNGCPYTDSDQDGIADKDDECPSIPGKSAFRGCPDTDGDGISDKYDLCPTIAGNAQNNGCPEIKKEEQEVINKAFSNLEFESGKSVIKSSSLSSLEELASLLKKKPEFKLLLSGHTDNVGKPASNMTLSKNRTLAVKKYLITKGVPDSQIRTEWFGQTKPVADNSTAEGRQRNRRVEMNIVFE